MLIQSHYQQIYQHNNNREEKKTDILSLYYQKKSDIIYAVVIRTINKCDATDILQYDIDEQVWKRSPNNIGFSGIISDFGHCFVRDQYLLFIGGAIDHKLQDKIIVYDTLKNKLFTSQKVQKSKKKDMKIKFWSLFEWINRCYHKKRNYAHVHIIQIEI